MYFLLVGFSCWKCWAPVSYVNKWHCSVIRFPLIKLQNCCHSSLTVIKVWPGGSIIYTFIFHSFCPDLKLKNKPPYVLFFPQDIGLNNSDSKRLSRHPHILCYSGCLFSRTEWEGSLISRLSTLQNRMFGEYSARWRDTICAYAVSCRSAQTPTAHTNTQIHTHTLWIRYTVKNVVRITFIRFSEKLIVSTSRGRLWYLKN